MRNTNEDTLYEILRMRSSDVSISEIARRLDLNRKTVQRFLNKETHKEWWAINEKSLAAGTLHDHRSKMPRLKNKVYILTSAQNDTFVHEGFLLSLEGMVHSLGLRGIDARIMVGTFSYNKKRDNQNMEKGEGWFDPKIQKYIYDEPAELAKGLIWCGELNILPTAVKPLSGFHSYTKDCSGVIPHAKVQMESLPRSKHIEDPRILYTTGAITKQNYIHKKAGQKAAFHHVFGALLVEVDEDGDWFARQLIADKNGEFYDLNAKYTPNGIFWNQRVEAINYGDIHAEKRDELACEASFGESDSMLEVLRPKYQFVHDVLDFSSRNSHNIADPYFRFKRFVSNRDTVKQDIEEVVEVLRKMQRPYTKTVVVESNHDLQLQRWLKNSDYKTDPANAIFFLECQLKMYKALEKGLGPREWSIFEEVVREMMDCSDEKNLKFLKEDESFMICGDQGEGIENGQHGNNGNGGARGSIASFTKLGSRHNIGHSHVAGILDGVYQAGHLGKHDYGYNVGATASSHSNIVTYPNGKRTIITIKRGKWRANF